MAIDELLERARRGVEEHPGPGLDDPALRDPLHATLAYLESEQALRDLTLDPYWPKWTTAWWPMVLLHELGLAERIPRRVAERMAEVMDAHFLHTFPLRFEDVPAGVDPYRHIVCHCALGSMFQVLTACGVDADAALPWARGWFLEYQLPDGGLNCDEEAYLRPTPRSSMVSTLPPAEALLWCTDRPFDVRETRFLSAAAAYLAERSLVRSLSRGGALIDAAWLTPCFPRFYFYDVLRGVRFLAGWAERCGGKVAWDAIAEVASGLDRWLRDGGPPRQPHRESPTYAPDGRGGWARAPAAGSFPLLDAVVPSGLAAGLLRREWLGALERLAAPDALA